MGVNPSTRAAGTGEDAGAVSTTVAAAARASRPRGRRSGGKGPEKPACELEPRNGSSAARMAARDITEGREGAGRGAREGSVPKGEREREEHCGWDAMVLMAARRVVGRKKETHFDRSVGTPRAVALDNTPHNKNVITRKAVTPSTT